MPFTRAGQLARSTLAVRATDPLALVAENLRSAPHGVLPVFDRVTFGPEDPSEHTARVVGLISQKDLSRVTQRMLVASSAYEGYQGGSNGNSANNGLYSGGLNGHASNGVSSNGYLPEKLETQAHNDSLPYDPLASEAVATETTVSPAWNELTARDVMQRDVPFIPEAFSLANALLTLERYDSPALPVYDAAGRYRGLVSRADLLSAIYGGIRPPLVGGMATPLGVWLTDGRLTGGAPPFGLFLTGLLLAGFFAISQVVLALGALLLNPTWASLTFSGRLGLMNPEGSLLNTIFFGIHALLFLGMFRLLPISGFHAAEHQVVHAMERGLPLEPAIVAKMPRAHPRCGTNLTAIAGLITIGIVHLPDVSPDYLILLLIATFFAWRAVGTLLQEVLTTRPASQAQLESGIKAAKELIEKYQKQQYATAPLPLRLLNSGMIPVALGWFLGSSAWYYATNWLAILILRR